MQSESGEYRLPTAIENAIKRPVREAVSEALAEASVTVEADETDSDSDATGDTGDDGSTGETEADSASSDSATDGRSWSRRRRGLLGLGLLVPLVGLGAFAQYRRERGDSGSKEEIEAGYSRDEGTDTEDGTDADPMPLSAADGE